MALSTRTYKDLAFSMFANPMNGDIGKSVGATAVKRAITGILKTNFNERVFQPEFGSRVTESLFDIADGVSAIAIRDEIRSSIINYEPRVKLLDVTVIPNPRENEMNVTIKYEIVGLDISPQQLDFVLLPTR